MTPVDPFLRHPREQGESYLEHAGVAASFGWRMLLGGAACMVHAALPFLFTTTGSRTVKSLSERMRARGHARAPQEAQRLAASREQAMADFGAGI